MRLQRPNESQLPTVKRLTFSFLMAAALAALACCAAMVFSVGRRAVLAKGAADEDDEDDDVDILPRIHTDFSENF